MGVSEKMGGATMNLISSTNRHLAIARHAHAQLVQLDDHTAAMLAHAHAQMLNLIQPALATVYRSIDTRQLAQHQQADGATTASLNSYHSELHTMKKAIVVQATYFASLAQSIIGHAQHQAIDLGVSSAHAHLSELGVPTPHTQPLPITLTRLADALQVHSPRARLFSGFGAEVARQAANAIGRGIMLGHSSREIAASVGSRLQGILLRAIVIASTAIDTAYRGAVSTLVSGNANGVVLGWIWACDLEGNPCIACIAMHGSKHPLSEVMGSHPRCHCQQVPFTATSGPIESGPDWFAQQPVDVQKALFDNDALYALYKDGVPLGAFVSHESDPVWGSSIQVKSAKDITKGQT